LLTTALGRCIRFAASDVRVFAGRESTGVRGIRLGDGDVAISMAILRHVEADPAERAAYLRQSAANRMALGDMVAAEGVEAEAAEIEQEEDVDVAAEGQLTPERFIQLGAAEEFILTVTDNGFGKRTSAYDYRLTGRGGQGLIAHNLARGGKLAASFPIHESDEVLLVTDSGQLIRTRVDKVRIAARNTQGVTIFRTGDGERVVSVERLEATGDEPPEDLATEDQGD
jgi:DNA gyrase subunit A